MAKICYVLFNGENYIAALVGTDEYGAVRLHLSPIVQDAMRFETQNDAFGFAIKYKIYPEFDMVAYRVKEH